MKTLSTIIIFMLLITAFIVPVKSASAEGEEPPTIIRPGFTEGVGTAFVLTNSEYLNITVTSTEVIQLTLESIPSVITMIFTPYGEATSSQIQLSGFSPGVNYYMYQDDNPSYVMFTADESGGYSYTQDL